MARLVTLSRWAALKEVLWTPAVAAVAALDAVSTLLPALRHTVFASLTFNSKIIEWIFSWHWQGWLAVWLSALILVILHGAVTAVQRREATIEELRKTIAESTGSIEPKLRAFSFWLQVDKDKEPVPTKMKMSDSGTLEADVPAVSLIVWNQSESMLKVVGYDLSLENQSGNFMISNQRALVAPRGHDNFDALPTLMGLVSGPGPWDFRKIKGTHGVLASLRYEEQGDLKRSEPVKCNVVVSFVPGGEFKLEITP